MTRCGVVVIVYGIKCRRRALISVFDVCAS